LPEILASLDAARATPFGDAAIALPAGAGEEVLGREQTVVLLPRRSSTCRRGAMAPRDVLPRAEEYGVT
jgi:hypothetical protein